MGTYNSDVGLRSINWSRLRTLYCRLFLLAKPLSTGRVFTGRSGKGSGYLAFLGNWESQPKPQRLRHWALLRSVDDWPLAKILIQISGGKPWSVAVDAFRGVDVTGFRYPPLEGCMSQARGCPFGDRSSCNLRRTTP